MRRHELSSLDVGVGLGSFKLGQSLWQTMGQIRHTAVPSVQVAWDPVKPARQPVLLTLKEPPLKLLFEGTQQLLCLLELNEPHQWLLYKGAQLQSDELPVTQKSLHKCLGPTFPLVPHPTNPNEQIMLYPGVAFVFRDANVVRAIVTSTTMADVTSASDLFKLAPTLPLPPNHHTLLDVNIKLGRVGQATSMEFTSPICKASCAIGQTHHQDLIADLGPPSRIYRREDDRLDIHARDAQVPLDESSSDLWNDPAVKPYFLNYFALGVDFLMHGTSHQLLKIILHSNIPGEVLFGRYNRCNWTLFAPGSAKGVNCKSSVSVIVKYLQDSEASNAAERSGEPLATFKLDRTADAVEDKQIGKTTELVGLAGLVLEKTHTNNAETVWLF